MSSRIKKVKKIFTPQSYETNIGKGEYVIEPQPIGRLVEFDSVVNQLREELGAVNTKYYVIRDGDDVAGPFEERSEAELNLNGSGDEIREEALSLRQVLDQLVAVPYPALKVLIPDLKEEDVKGASLPNLKFVLDLLIEVNGVEWFEAFLKNSIGPLLPEIIQMVTGVFKRELIETSTETPGGTTLTTSSEN